MQLHPYIWRISARATHTDGRKSDWSQSYGLRIEPESSAYQNYGGLPSRPRNVRVAPGDNCEPDRPADQRPNDPDPNPDYDWDDCLEWNISWDGASTHGGWPIDRYMYGPSVVWGPYDGFPPELRCSGGTWRPSPIYTHNPAIESDPKAGRTYGFTMGVSIPENWTIAIQTANGKGTSDCIMDGPVFP